MEKLIFIYLLFDAFIACLFYKELRGKAYIIPALIALGVAGYQAYQGYQQKKKAKNLKPSNYVPASVHEAVAGARSQATSDSSGYTRGLERLKQSSASTLSAAKKIGGSATQLQQTVADTDAREKETVKDLEVSNAEFKNQGKANLQNMLLTKGGYEQQSQDAYNATKSALIGASEQNKYNAVTGLAEGAVSALPDSAFGAGLSTGLSKGARSAGGGGGIGNTNSLMKNGRMNMYGQYGKQGMRGKNGLGRMSPYDFSGYYPQNNFQQF